MKNSNSGFYRWALTMIIVSVMAVIATAQQVTVNPEPQATGVENIRRVVLGSPDSLMNTIDLIECDNFILLSTEMISVFITPDSSDSITPDCSDQIIVGLGSKPKTLAIYGQWGTWRKGGFVVIFDREIDESCLHHQELSSIISEVISTIRYHGWEQAKAKMKAYYGLFK